MAILLVPFVWLLDQWSKKYAREHFKNSNRQYHFGDKVSFWYVENKGAFLGLLGSNQQLLKGITVGAILLLLIISVPYWFMSKGRWTAIGLALMLGGALGNATDRFKDGYVTDFIAFYPEHKVHFNIADFAIFKGTLLIFIGELLGK